VTTMRRYQHLQAFGTRRLLLTSPYRAVQTSHTCGRCSMRRRLRDTWVQGRRSCWKRAGGMKDAEISPCQRRYRGIRCPKDSANIASTTCRSNWTDEVLCRGRVFQIDLILRRLRLRCQISTSPRLNSRRNPQQVSACSR
jgi:hypothetical protein